jgi:hypothetical protein
MDRVHHSYEPRARSWSMVLHGPSAHGKASSLPEFSTRALWALTLAVRARGGQAEHTNIMGNRRGGGFV